MGIFDFVHEAITQVTHGGNLRTSDEALDRAADFQDGFREYIDLYNRYTGSSLSMETDIQRPYDELREIDFGRLAEVAERTAQIGDDLDQQLEDVNTQVATVDGWTGDAANAFRGHIQQFTTAAQTVEHDLGAVATATAEAVSATQGIIAEYVDAIGDIDFSGFDSTGDIAFMIEIEQMLRSVGDVISAVLDWLGDLIGVSLPVPGSGGGLLGSVTGFVMDRLGDAVDFILDALGMSVDGFLDWIASKVREYLDASFKSPFEANLQLLNDAVEAARTGVQEAFQPMVDAAAAVTQNPFGQLPSPPEDNPNQTQPAPPQGSDGTGTGTGGGSAAGTVSGTGGSPVPSMGGGGGGPSAGTPSVPQVEVPAPAPDQPVAGAPEVPGVGDESGVGDGLGVVGEPGAGDGLDERPEGLPPGAGWIADPSQLPPGWTVDPETGELLPPGAPGGAGDPEVHSPEGQGILDGDVSILPVHEGPFDDGLGLGEDSLGSDGLGAEPDPLFAAADTGQPAAERPVAQPASFGVGGSLDAAAAGVSQPFSPGTPVGGPAGEVPAATVAAAVGFAGAGDPTPSAAGQVSGGGPSFASGAVSGDGSGAGASAGQVSGGGSGSMSGQVSGGGSGFAASGSPGGMPAGEQVASGSISSGPGPAGTGSAQLASAVEAGGSPGGAQLASVGENASGAGAPMMPLGAGAAGGGDEERRGGQWQAPGGDVFEPDEVVGNISGVLGEDR